MIHNFYQFPTTHNINFNKKELLKFSILTKPNWGKMCLFRVIFIHFKCCFNISQDQFSTSSLFWFFAFVCCIYVLETTVLVTDPTRSAPVDKAISSPENVRSILPKKRRMRKDKLLQCTVYYKLKIWWEES